MLLSPPPSVTLLQALISLGNCNPVVSQDPLMGTYATFTTPPLTLLQALISLGNCNPVVSQDPLMGTYAADPIHLGFRLHINMSYIELAATPGTVSVRAPLIRHVVCIPGPLSSHLRLTRWASGLHGPQSICMGASGF